MGRVSSCWWVWLRLCSLFVWVVCFEHVPRACKTSDGNICINGIESKGTGIANTLIMNLATWVLIGEFKGYKTKHMERRGIWWSQIRWLRFLLSMQEIKSIKLSYPFG